MYIFTLIIVVGRVIFILTCRSLPAPLTGFGYTSTSVISSLPSAHTGVATGATVAVRVTVAVGMTVLVFAGVAVNVADCVADAVKT